VIKQEIIGDNNLTIAISGDIDTLMYFASCYSMEEITDIKKSISIIGKFLSFINGIFTMYWEEEDGINLEIKPFEYFEKIQFDHTEDCYFIPTRIQLGKLIIIISKNKFNFNK
jgi:hypothetical protein